MQIGNYRYLIYLLLLLPAFFFRDFTPMNELKYISIVEEAFRNNTWFTFYNHGEIYADKPPLFFWLIMLSRVIAGGYYTWIIGLFTLIPTMGILVLMDKWLKSENIMHIPVVSNLLLLTTAMFTGATLFIRMDMLMVFFIVLSLYTFFRIYKHKHQKYEEYMLPVYIFLAVFSKGTIGFLVPVLSIVSFLVIKKQIKTFSSYLGWKQWGIMLTLFFVWFLAVYLESGKDYLVNMLFKQTVGRGIRSFSHSEPFWFYLPRIPVSFAPWSLLYIVLIWMGVKKQIIKGDIRIFFVSVIVTTFVLLSLVSAKIDIYLLPVYPFAVYLCSSLLSGLGHTKAARVSIAIPALLCILTFPVSFFIVHKLPYEYTDLILLRIGLALAMAGGILAIVFLRSVQTQKAIIALSSGLLCMVFVVAFALPQFNKYIGFGEMAAEANRIAKKENISQYVYYRFYASSNVDAYLKKSVEEIHSMSELDSLIGTGKKSILFVRRSVLQRENELSQRLEKQRLIWHAGINMCYVIGDQSKPVDVQR